MQSGNFASKSCVGFGKRREKGWGGRDAEKGEKPLTLVSAWRLLASSPSDSWRARALNCATADASVMARDAKASQLSLVGISDGKAGIIQMPLNTFKGFYLILKCISPCVLGYAYVVYLYVRVLQVIHLAQSLQSLVATIINKKLTVKGR